MSKNNTSTRRDIARVYASDSSRLDDTVLARAKELVLKGKAVVVESTPYSVQLTFEYEMGKSARRVLDGFKVGNPVFCALSLAAREAYREVLEYLIANRLFYRLPDDANLLANIINASLQESISVRNELAEKSFILIDAGYIVFTHVHSDRNGESAARHPLSPEISVSCAINKKGCCSAHDKARVQS